MFYREETLQEDVRIGKPDPIREVLLGLGAARLIRREARPDPGAAKQRDLEAVG